MKLSLGTLQKQILLTLSYSQVFNKPLTSTEIFIRLLSLSSAPPAKMVEVLAALDQLQGHELVVKRGELWHLNNRSPDLSSIRRKRERLSAMKLQELQPFITFSRMIPWIQGVAVTGSVSVQNADARDDVDLMIITKRNRLWLARPLLVLFSFLKGKRRSWNKEEYNSWCLNLWLEADAMRVIPDKRSMYTAYEVCQARWLISRYNAERTFLFTNSWVKQFIPTYFAHRINEVKEKSKLSSHWWLINDGLDLANSVAYTLQRWYMNRHMTTERVGLTYAFFHPRDTRKNIVDQ